MNELTKNLIKEIIQLENFDLKTYHKYIKKYGKSTMQEVFNMILEHEKDLEMIFNKYFDVYFSIELEETEIDDDTYIKFTNKYGEEKVNNYFIKLLEISKNPTQIKEKYEKIYFYIEINQSKENLNTAIPDTDDSVKCYLKDIGNYELLTAEEEKSLTEKIEISRQNVEIACFDELDNIILFDPIKLISSIKTLEQLKKLKKIVPKLSDEDKKIIETQINNLSKVLKNAKRVDNDSLDVYDEDYLNKQLHLLINFINARETLINSNLRLVVSIAKRYTMVSGIEISDLMQEGNIGLMKAIKKFDRTKKTKLSTYATWWIRQSITRYISENNRTIRISVHYNDKILKYQQVLKRYLQENGQNPTEKYLADALGTTVTEIHNLQKFIYTSTCVSLDSSIGEDDDVTVVDMIPDDKKTEDIVFSSELKQIFIEIFETLSIREREVIKHRYGFYNGRIYTLEEIGQKFGVTRERIRQIENKTLRKLRHSSRTKYLKGYI